VEQIDTDPNGSDEPSSRWRSLLDRRVRARSTLPEDSAHPRTAPPQTPMHPDRPPLPAGLAPVRPDRPPLPAGLAPVRPDNPPIRPDLAPIRPDSGLIRSSSAPRRPETASWRPDSATLLGGGLPPRTEGSRPDGHEVRPTINWQSARPADGADRLADVLRMDLGGPRVVAFANPKGGVHKTTATVLCAAAVGGVRGRGVIAWDDNELRGTLGLRAGSARHARTIRHLVADLVGVEASHGSALADRLDDYLRHASDGTYDVLAGEENPRFAQQLDPPTVRRVLELLRRTHDVICVDTGNNVESANWQTVLQMADQLVVTTVPREDAAFTADWMLDLLDKAGMGELVKNAVTLLSCPTPRPTPLLDELAAHFATRTRAVTVVPYDPALESGSSIEYSDLRPATRRAWLAAAAVMLEPFAR
jgi:MinD-like ATPase involved in chromosome partitioning or flagellar assembly